jgi:hypothetical protein
MPYKAIVAYLYTGANKGMGLDLAALAYLSAGLDFYERPDDSSFAYIITIYIT